MHYQIIIYLTTQKQHAMSTKPTAVTAPKTKGTSVAQTENTTKKAKDKAQVDKANVDKATKTVKEQEESTERKTKYIYPENLTPKEKKDFRRQARADLARFEKSLKKLKKDTTEEGQKLLQKEQKAFDKFQTATYTPAE